MHQLCRACVFAKRIAARHTQIGQPLVLKQQKQESLTCFIRFYLTVQDCIDKIKQNPTVRREYMDLQEFIDRERREAVAKAEEEKNKLSDQLKATVAERDKVSEKLDITTAERDKAAAERDKATAERDQIRIDQRNYQELTSILIDKNLFDELKHAA